MKPIALLIPAAVLALSSSALLLSAPAAPLVEVPIALVPNAISGGDSETAIFVYNDSPTARTIRVEWYDGFGSYVGQTGPASVPAGWRTSFVSSVPGENWNPIAAHFGRDLNIDFPMGSAIVYSDPEGFRGIALDAMRLKGRGKHADLTDDELESIHVVRYKDAGPRQAGD